MNGNIEKLKLLEEYFDLKQQGILTEAEFIGKKKELLGGLQPQWRKIEESASQAQQPQAQQPQPQQSQAQQPQDCSQPNAYNNVNYSSAPPKKEPAISRKPTNVLAYLGLLWFLAYFLGDKDNCRFHLNQGLVLLVLSAAVGIAAEIVAGVAAGYLAWTYPGLSIFISIVIFAISAFVTVLAIMGIVNAAKDRENKLPLIGDIIWIKPVQ